MKGSIPKRTIVTFFKIKVDIYGENAEKFKFLFDYLYISIFSAIFI